MFQVRENVLGMQGFVRCGNLRFKRIKTREFIKFDESIRCNSLCQDILYMFMGK